MVLESIKAFSVFKARFHVVRIFSKVKGLK